MDTQGQQQQTQGVPPVTVSGGADGQTDSQRNDNDGDVIFYMEEPKAGTPHRARRDNR